MPIQIGDIHVIEEFALSNLVTECIVGMPLLKSAGFQLDLKNMTINTGTGYIPVYDSQGKSICCRVTIDKTTSIPANHEMLISGCINFRGENTSEPFMLEPSVKFMTEEGVLIAKVLVSSENSHIPIRIYNPQDEPVILFKGSNIGIVTPVNCILQEVVDDITEPKTVNNVTAGEQENIDLDKITVPEHLQDLWKRGSEHISLADSKRLAHLLTKYQHIYSKSDDDIGETNIVEHEIVTTDNVPIKQPPRRLPKCSEVEVDRQVNDLLQRKKIIPSWSSYSSPVVLVGKKDGTKRLCIDYRKLNDKTVKDAYAIPVISDMLNNLSGASWFSTFDLSSGYWQVRLSEDAQLKSAFCTRQGLFQWLIMPFGLTNAPGTFQRMMDKVLSGLSWKIAMVYLDDIICIGKSVSDCLTNMEQIFERLSKAGLKLKPKKCHLLQKSVKYLGYVVSEAGIQTDPEKVNKIKEWPIPENTTELRSLLGLAGYYRKHCPNFAMVCKPLYKLCESGQKFVMNKERVEAIEKLKLLLTQSPILAFPKEEGEYILDTDASDFGIGAVLSQVQDGVEKVIAYSSRTLSKAERKYCVTRKELLAIVYHVRYFKEYIYGIHFTVRTDHGSLQWLSKFKDIELGQMARWFQILSEYNYTIITRPGRCNQNADALSRIPCSGKKCICQTLNSDKNPIIDCYCKTTEIGVQTESVVNTHKIAKVKKSVQTPTKLWTKEEMIEAQELDSDIGPIIKLKLSHDNKPEWEELSSESAATKALWSSWNSLSIRNDMLYRKWETLDGKIFHWQLVVPRKFRDTVLAQLHDHPMSGHLGVRRTTKRIQTRYYWYKMKNDIQFWIKTCIPCQAKDTHGRKPRAKLKQYVVGNRWERIATDICGPFPKSNKNNKFILVVTDYFSKFTEAYAIPNMEAETVANKLVKEWVCRYGCPMQLHSDQGANYQSALFREVCKLLKIEQTRTTPYHPQSDGQAEKFMSTLKSMITKMVESHESEGDWEEVLPFVIMAYNSSINETTKATPNSLLFGEDISLPIDLATERVPNEQRNTNSDQYAQFAMELENKLWEGHHRARDHTKSAMVHQKRGYHKNVSHKSIYQRGNLVWLNNPKNIKGKTPSLQNPWDGPYVVLKAMSDVVFKIQKGPTSKPKIIHYNRLKPFYARNPINLKWMDKIPTIDPVEMDGSDESSIGDINSDSLTNEPDLDNETGNDTNIETDQSESASARPRRQVKRPNRYGEWDYGINFII